MIFFGSFLRHIAATEFYEDYLFGIEAKDNMGDGSGNYIDIRDFHLFFDFSTLVGNISFNLKKSNQSELNSMEIIFPKVLSITDEQITDQDWSRRDDKAINSTRGEDYYLGPITCDDRKGSCSASFHRNINSKFGLMNGVTIQLKGKLTPLGGFKIGDEDFQSKISSGGGSTSILSLKLGDYGCVDAFCVKKEYPDDIIEKRGGYIDISTKGLKEVGGRKYEIYTVNEKKQGKISFFVSIVAGLIFFILQLLFSGPFEEKGK